MKLVFALTLLPALALAQSNPDSRGGAAVCPLSPEQTQASIDVFEKFVPILKDEPRCTNCHGGVDPFIDGVGDPANPLAPHVEHGGGKMDRAVVAIPATGDTPAVLASEESDCSLCHDNLAPKVPSGEPSVWKLPAPFMSFVGKDSPTLCAQIKAHSTRCEGGICGPWPDSEKFIGHVTDDEGHDNFTATAFSGNRGLNAKDFDHIKPEPPKGITAAGLIALGNEWVDTTNGKFHGDTTCGCKVAEYAIRISAATEMNRGGVAFKSALEPLDIPITFANDGTFQGSGVGVFRASSQVMATCNGQSATSLGFNVSGKAVQNVDEQQSMHVRIESTAATTTLDIQCRPVGGASTRNTAAQQTVLEFDLVGDVGEYVDYAMAPPTPGFTSSARVQIVKLK